MRSLTVSLLLVFLTVPWVGCGTRSTSSSGNSDFAGRLNAAKSINATSSKDEALSKLAIDAAAGGDGEIAKQAVEAISSTAIKDSAASQAAVTLAKVGKSNEANAVARLIHSTATRDSTLAKIAKGE